MSSTNWLLRNATYFDGVSEDLHDGADIVIEGGVIREIEKGAAKPDGFEEMDLSGLMLLPGLIDNHTHVYASELNLTNNMRRPWTYLSHYAAKFLKQALSNGFTSIRDVGGGDHGLAQAIDDGLVEGPRLFYGGRILSQSGGHADWRPPSENDPTVHLCNCGATDQKLAVLADGKEGVIKAVREELRRGASHIKILASGGVASPSDPVDDLQYSDEEITAIVDECSRRHVYVAAHCHPANSIERSVRLGVRSIEHATLIDDVTAEFVATTDAYIVPTMAVIYALQKDGATLGLPPASVAKINKIYDRAMDSLGVMKKAGCRIGFGTDLLGPQYDRQGTEFTLRKDTFSPIEILRQATSMNAEILQQEGKLGCIKPGAHADLIAVKGNPFNDIEILSRNGETLSLIMKGGRVMKNEI